MRALSITRLPVPHHMRLTTCLRGKNETTFIKTTSGRNLAGSTSSFCQHPSNKPTSRYGGPRTLLADPFIASSTWDERRKTSDDQHFNDSTCVAMGKGDWGRSGVPSRQAGEINSRGMECKIFLSRELLELRTCIAVIKVILYMVEGRWLVSHSRSSLEVYKNTYNVVRHLYL